MNEYALSIVDESKAWSDETMLNLVSSGFNLMMQWLTIIKNIYAMNPKN